MRAVLAALLCASATAKSVAELSAKAAPKRSSRPRPNLPSSANTAPKWPPKPKPQKSLQRAPDIRVDCATVRNSPVSPLVNWTRSDYAQFAAQPAGAEHYKLLSHLASQVGAGTIVEVGTRYGAGALTLSGAAPAATVHTIDLPISREFETEVVAKSKPRPTVLRGGGTAEGSVTVYNEFPKIHFHKATILAQPDGAAAQQVYKARFVLLDTLHEPEAHPFEYEFLALLGRRNFRGLLMLDDIHLNAEMRRLWDALYWGKVPGLPLHKYALYDATAVGHFSGSGLVDFQPSHDKAPLPYALCESVWGRVKRLFAG